MITEVFELVDSSDDERYYPLGVFLTVEDANAALGDKPWELAEFHECTGYVTLQLRKRPIGIAEGHPAWTRSWEETYPEDSDEPVWIEK